MKKRSLFAAVAMLIVSALVLTSATYAWFQTTGSVTIPTMTATSSGQSTGLMVAARNREQDWKFALEWSDYSAAGSQNVWSQTLVPVTGTVDTTAEKYVTLRSGDLNSQEFSWTNTEATAGFIKYETFVKEMSANTATISVSPYMGAMDSGAAIAPFVYYAAKVEAVTTGDSLSPKYYFANSTSSSKSYTALTGGTVTTGSGHFPYIDANVNSIIDNDYVAAVMGTDPDTGDPIVVTPASGSNEFTRTVDSVTETLTYAAMSPARAFDQDAATTALSFAAVKDHVYKITVWVWAEGQDADCNRSAAASSVQVTLDLSMS